MDFYAIGDRWAVIGGQDIKPPRRQLWNGREARIGDNLQLALLQRAALFVIQSFGRLPSRLVLVATSRKQSTAVVPADEINLSVVSVRMMIAGHHYISSTPQIEITLFSPSWPVRGRLRQALG